jgi:hypothetical protein
VITVVGTSDPPPCAFVPTYFKQSTSASDVGVYIYIFYQNIWNYVYFYPGYAYLIYPIVSDPPSDAPAPSIFYFNPVGSTGTNFIDFSAVQTLYNGYYLYDQTYGQWLIVTTDGKFELSGSQGSSFEWYFSPSTPATVDFPAPTTITLESVTTQSSQSNVYSYNYNSSTGTLSLLTPVTVTNLQYALNIFLPSSGVPDSFTVYIECDSSFDYGVVQFVSFTALGTSNDSSPTLTIASLNNLFSFYTAGNTSGTVTQNAGITATWNPIIQSWVYSYAVPVLPS